MGSILASRQLEGVILGEDRIRHLFFQYASCCPLHLSLGLTMTSRFFANYHPYLPMLEPAKTPDEYYAASQLLFWVIIAVAARKYDADPGLLGLLAGPVTRMLWDTIQSVPQSYYVVQALCIICTWPMPISSTTADPTVMFSGMMMAVAHQIGLHRPSHPQDFGKVKIELREEELKDRIRTWASCNAVAQRYVERYRHSTINVRSYCCQYCDWLRPTPCLSV